MQYNVHEAKTHFSRLLEQACQGEDVVIAKAGIPFVRLVPVESPKRRELGFLSGEFSVGDEIFESLDSNELEEWGT